MGSQYGIAQDPDVVSYIKRANIQNIIAMRQIYNFTKEIKKLNLWNNMVCWPLRSTQNAGTGTIAYSLGGLGTYNGTLTSFGGSFWSADGVIFDGSDDYIVTTFTSALSAFSYINISKNANLSGVQIEISKDNEDAIRESSLLLAGGNYAFYAWNPNFNSLYTAGGTTNWKAIISRASSTVYKSRLNNQSGFSGTAGTLTTGSDVVCIGGNGVATRYFNGTIALSILFNIAISDTETDLIYSLIKSTLGQGLGLP